MTSEITTLVAKLESAKAPSRQLDVRILKAAGLTPLQERHCADWCRQDGRTDLTRARYISAWAPSYTSSLDAALTLVPEGWEWEMSWLAGVGYASLGDPLLYMEGEASTVPLALCVASLKARLHGAQK